MSLETPTAARAREQATRGRRDAAWLASGWQSRVPSSCVGSRAARLWGGSRLGKAGPAMCALADWPSDPMVPDIARHKAGTRRPASG
ncbi:hypothetical protein GCM10022251_02590 [Phytohabitans flavus]